MARGDPVFLPIHAMYRKERDAMVWGGSHQFEHGRLLGMLDGVDPPFVVLQRYTKDGRHLLDPHGPKRDRAFLCVPAHYINLMEKP